jgi:hypothetical protein
MTTETDTTIQGDDRYTDPDDYRTQEDAERAENAPVYVHLGNAQTGEVDSAGPFDFVQVTYGSFVRVENVADGVEDFTIATMGGNGLWLWDDGSEWTDLTISTRPR